MFLQASYWQAFVTGTLPSNILVKKLFDEFGVTISASIFPPPLIPAPIGPHPPTPLITPAAAAGSPAASTGPAGTPAPPVVPAVTKENQFTLC